jgi:hypothetical protein
VLLCLSPALAAALRNFYDDIMINLHLTSKTRSKCEVFGFIKLIRLLLRHRGEFLKSLSNNHMTGAAGAVTTAVVI